jgi:hypothetical protein
MGLQPMVLKVGGLQIYLWICGFPMHLPKATFKGSSISHALEVEISITLNKLHMLIYYYVTAN